MSMLIVAALAATAAADWKNMDGERVPEISADKWINAGKNAPTTADLRGKVYLLEFFSTT
jgi:hypothetical protein